MKLRAYQENMILNARKAIANHRSIMLQAPTGSGKTFLFTVITKLALKKGNIVWIIVPRNELLEQASDSLSELNIDHGIISAKSEESSLYNVHVVSKDTLIRRIDRIKVKPNLMIIDEAHLAIDRYKKFAVSLPNTKIIAVSATPERLDGKGLNDLYEVLVLGPSIKSLIEEGWLSDLKYFCPPIQGIENLHRKGIDFDADEVEQLLQKRKIYGSAIEHYKKYADGKPTLVYCRSIKAADETATKFNASGYRFENIDGTMSYKKRKSLINALKDGQIQGLTSCDLITYGLDVPRVECIIMLRPTLSRVLFSQMIGRGLRPFPGKKNLIVLDHVGNLQIHGHPLEDHQWNFEGREKRNIKRETNIDSLKLCVDSGYMYCSKTSCVGCEFNLSGKKERKPLEQIEGELVEQLPIPLKNRPINERAVIEEQIKKAVEKGSVVELIRLCDSLGYDPLWVYNQLTAGRYSINVPLLYEIARLKKFKPGWAFFQMKRLKERKNG